MATSPGTVVFVRGEEREDSDDIWDDSALVEAYDRAVNLAKDEIRNRNSGSCASVSASATESNSTPRGTKKKNKKTMKQKAKRYKWNVGDKCFAIYKEDGLVYEAVIESVDRIAATCNVRFVGYGNTDEVLLAELLPSQNAHSKYHHHHRHADDGAHSNVDGYDNQPWGEESKYSSTHARRNNSSAKSSGGRSKQYMFPPPPPPPPPPLPPMFMPPGFGWSGMPVPPFFPGSHGTSQSNLFRNMPAMPPPPSFEDIEDLNDETLAAMLMSWYMSGYHTGYYLGLKQGRRSSSSPFRHT